MKIIKRLFTRKSTFHVKADHVIVKAFTHRGVDYYCFHDVFTIPCKRAQAGLMYYEEMSMRMTKDFMLQDLQAHKELNKQIKEALSGKEGGIDLSAAFKHLAKSDQLINQKKERIEWILEPETLYNLASVIYFDEKENPYEYDAKYGKEKIARWKKGTDGEVLNFFLQQPIRTWLPYLTQSADDLKDFLTVIEALTADHLANISDVLYKNTLSKDLSSSLK